MPAASEELFSTLKLTKSRLRSVVTKTASRDAYRKWFGPCALSSF